MDIFSCRPAPTQNERPRHSRSHYEVAPLMRTIHLLSALGLLIAFNACQPDKPEPPPVKKISAKDRNMFGHGVPRGLLTSAEGLAEGYVLFPVPNATSMYLINRKGEVVHEWTSNYKVMNGYLCDDGSLIQNVHDPDFPVFAGGGETGRIQRISWDSKVQWEVELASEEHHVHHDFTLMPNGNILAIAWESKTPDEALAAGRKPELLPKAGLWPDKIIEIQPQGANGGTIVWEWHMWDHLVQNYDKTKKNYGNPAEHPELLDFNLGEPPPVITQDSLDALEALGRRWRNQTPENMGSDLYHVNSIKYNADLDQIAFGSPDLNEIFIIDHSTTTKEAAGHRGGRYGKGGDFLYRWGNPKNYHRGDSTDQKLFFQHDVRWIATGEPGAGNLTIFNNNIPNRDSLNYSAVYEITPPMDAKGNYILEDGKPYGPGQPAWIYIAPDTISFYSSFISGAHRLKNGNTFITEGASARFFEVDKDGKLLWEYLNPYRGKICKPNGDPVLPVPMTYSAFRATFIPADHPGLANKKLEPLEPQPIAFVLPPPKKPEK